jgi:DDE family transposase
MTGAKLRQMMETMLPDALLGEVADATGFHQRDRKRNAVKFLRTMLIAASSPSGGRQADIMRHYFEMGVERVVRGSFYDWFGPPLEAAMAKLAEIVMTWARAQPVDLPGILGDVVDWRIVDSETVVLNKRLLPEYPSTGDYAALKVHKTLSVGIGTTVAYHLSPAREHDSPHLRLDETWRGMGLLVDLGYASVARLRECQTYGVSVIIRLKDGWKPKVQRVARADLKKTFVPGTDLDLFLNDVYLELGNVVDVDVTVGAGDLPVRLIGVRVPDKGYRFYLTNVGRRLGPHQIADLYRVRWEIETNNKLDKSSHRLEEIDAKRGPAVRAMVHASLISSVLVNSIVHTHNRVTPTKADRRTRPPLHAGLVARMLATAAFRITDTLELSADAAAAEWDKIAAIIVHASEDPNWRTRPSILDQLRGWCAVPAAKKKLSSRMHV